MFTLRAVFPSIVVAFVLSDSQNFRDSPLLVDWSGTGVVIQFHAWSVKIYETHYKQMV